MFSKALFKQSCKANGIMWAVITFAVCFMLACVMLISGSGSIGETTEAIQNTIINKEINATLEQRAIGYYGNEIDGMEKFDGFFVARAKAALENSPNPLLVLMNKEEVAKIYGGAVEDLKGYLEQKAVAIDPSYTEDSAQAQELLASVMYAINPNGMFDEFYTSHGEEVPPEYDVTSFVTHYLAGDLDAYLAGAERAAYRAERSETCSAVFLAGNITMQENVDKIVNELASFGVTQEKYDSFGYTYGSVKRLAASTVITYRNRREYDMRELDAKLGSGEIDAETYKAEEEKIKADLTAEIASSLLASLPKDVADALEEVGQLDLYSLVVGSIFYKLAGLLLPIIYMIMASNNLISGQVDSGSMAYVLATSTKRKTVVFTQALFLISSLFAMFTLTTVTGCICLACVDGVLLTFGELILLNVGAFLVLFALSGLCFFTSCLFDRSKRSMAVGGGLSIFALVAAMLGLFGSHVIPKVVRLDALNNFNYVTVISLFDAISIIDGTVAFIWKFAILAVLGIVGYIAGAFKFVKKDLPL